MIHLLPPPLDLHDSVLPLPRYLTPRVFPTFRLDFPQSIRFLFPPFCYVAIELPLQILGVVTRNPVDKFSIFFLHSSPIKCFSLKPALPSSPWTFAVLSSPLNLAISLDPTLMRVYRLLLIVFGSTNGPPTPLVFLPFLFFSSTLPPQLFFGPKPFPPSRILRTFWIRLVYPPGFWGLPGVSGAKPPK